MAESMLSERDYLDKIVVLGRSSKTTRVEQIMSEKDLISVHPDDTLLKVMELMTEKRVRHVPVIAHGGHTLGLVSDRFLHLLFCLLRNSARFNDFPLFSCFAQSAPR
jgi:signal-transduction protein with cAMP-binding, CBS, and nucleotidyltransferase domain